MVEKKTHSYLTQIASVSYSKDNTEILKETVLKPIGEGLELLVSGGKFIVLDNDYNLQYHYLMLLIELYTSTVLFKYI